MIIIKICEEFYETVVDDEVLECIKQQGLDVVDHFEISRKGNLPPRWYITFPFYDLSILTRELRQRRQLYKFEEED